MVELEPQTPCASYTKLHLLNPGHDQSVGQRRVVVVSASQADVGVHLSIRNVADDLEPELGMADHSSISGTFVLYVLWSKNTSRRLFMQFAND